jgi:5-methyltetrahydrofolate--homocysteine methyltransferase
MPSVSPRLEGLLSHLRAGKMVLADGAWGTRMQAMGLQGGDCPEEWNVSKPEQIKQIAHEYFEAGADFCMSNTFGGTKYRLVRHGYADKVHEFNRAGAALSVEVANKFDRPVGASVGPTGEFIEPEGMLSHKEMRDAFREQMAALKEGGADFVCIETMYVVDEAVAAIKAARELDLFCAVCMTYDSDGRGGYQTMTYATIEESIHALDQAGADILGTNCGHGIAEMVKIARLIRPLTKKPLMVKSNAGLPKQIDGKLVYRETPQMLADHVTELRDIGIGIVGGCCGTTPEHIAALRKSIDA